MSRKSKQLGLDVVDTHMGLFDYTVRVCVGDHEKAKEYIAYVFEEKYDELADGNRGYEARGICYHRTGYVPIVWLPRYPETPREYATLAHEVIHAVNHLFDLFDWSATPLTRDTEETFAHSVAHVINNALLKLPQRLPQTKTKKKVQKNATRKEWQNTAVDEVDYQRYDSQNS